MNLLNKRILSVIICVVITMLTAVNVSADRKTDLQNDIADLKAQAAQIQKDIDRLKQQKSDQNVILSAIQKKVANTKAQIARCNSEINSINAKISANKAEIDAKNKEIEQCKLTFKKRIRAIYMSNTGSNVQILLGAENFADYLQLAQLTAAVSAHDKQIIEDMVSHIDELNKKNAENEKLLKEQVAVRATIAEQQKQLEADEASAQSIYNKIAQDQKNAQNDKNKVNNDIKEKQDELRSFAQGGSHYNGKINANTGFMWPVPGHYRVSSGWGYRWGDMHYGIDINDGSIYRAPIVAIADGTIYRIHTSCPHKDKTPDCRCGKGWGNHIGINHGTMAKIDGAVYKAMYAHMDTVAAGMYVGKEVKQGDVIGYVGTTGWSTGYHLHFGLYRNDVWVNPSKYL